MVAVLSGSLSHISACRRGKVLVPKALLSNQFLLWWRVIVMTMVVIMLIIFTNDFVMIMDDNYGVLVGTIL